MTAYEQLAARFARANRIGGALAVLHWDQAVMMPDGGAEVRAEQIATLSVLRHELLTEARLADLLDAAERDGGGDTWRAANLREMRRAWRHANALPGDLVAARSRAASTCEMVWRKARADDDFAALLPSFEEVVLLTRDVAQAKAASFGIAPYEALVDEYEPAGKVAAFDAIFADLGAFLPGFIADALESQAAQPEPAAPQGPFPIEAQRQLGLRMMAALGFDFRHGRLDISLHPFTGGVPQDVRITTRYAEADFTKALMGVLHETGHALYELGLPAEWRDQPVGEARGMVLHESQSLLVEMQVCRGPEFLNFAAPLMREAFGGSSAAWDADNIARLYRRVAPGLIRVDADEVTYPAHILLRYRLEQALLSGDLPLKELPHAWADGMKTLLGVEAPDDRDGCLQDIHWPTGSFGYFPTYTLGAIAAAQLFAAARAQDSEILPAIARGDFAPLLVWLRRHVHSQGSLDTTDGILLRATGAPLNAVSYKNHLRSRYLH